MARSVQSYTWENGFRQPAAGSPWVWDLGKVGEGGEDDPNEWVAPPSKDMVTSAAHNELGINILRTWPTLFDGTNSPHGVPSRWKPSSEVDVLICGAGPSGLQVALSLARQGVSFRIIDKAEAPLIAGRADGVQPRFLETVATWGLADEIAEEGPLIERTAIYKDGKKILFNRSHQCDSRYRGLHIITQGQIERVYIRDLARHRSLVERSTYMTGFTVEHGRPEDSPPDFPVKATVRNAKTGAEEAVRAKFVVGSDGGSSTVRKSLGIPFDGVSTNIYWGIMDCVYESDYPHAWVFGSVISSEHGGCVIIPREEGYIRLYTQLDVSAAGEIARGRYAVDSEAGGRVDINTITPDEVLAQANRIFAPYKLKFAAPLAWFAIWKISERVARTYSSPDMRVHLVGDAAHVHSVMGAFGLNASILDSANLAWKLGLAAKGKAKLETLLPTYSEERRGHAVRIIETSGTYLRFVCGSGLAVPNLHDVAKLDASTDGDKVLVACGTSGKAAEGTTNGPSDGPVDDPVNGSGETAFKPLLDGSVKDGSDQFPKDDDLAFLASFFKANGNFLLGVDCPYSESVVNVAHSTAALANSATGAPTAPLRVRAGVRAPNPRICLGIDKTGYLYDTFAGPPRFHVVLFLSSLRGAAVRRATASFARALPDWYHRLGGPARFHVVAIVKCLPFELAALREARAHDEAEAGLAELWSVAQVVFDDRAPDEDAHTTWGANHGSGAVAVVRPDLWVGTTAGLKEAEKVRGFFDGFLLP